MTTQDKRKPAVTLALWAYLGGCRDDLPDEVVADLQTRFDAVDNEISRLEAEVEALKGVLRQLQADECFYESHPHTWTHIDALLSPQERAG